MLEINAEAEEERIPAFIINLESDTMRRKKILEQISSLSKFKPTIISALNGGTLPDSVRLLLADNYSWIKHKGALGCFLSHVKVWELASNLKADFVVVLEDDANVTSLDLIATLNFPADFDIIFINDRMVPKAVNYESEFLSMGEALRHVNVERHGFGTDGYIISPRAAARLLEACQSDLYFGHIDGRLVRYATSESDLDTVGRNSLVATIIEQHHNPRRKPLLGLLKGYVTSTAYVRHAGLSSSRDAIDEG